jgi:hypothetical protein
VSFDKVPPVINISLEVEKGNESQKKGERIDFALKNDPKKQFGIHVKIVLFFTPQAPFKRLHFRSRKQKSFQLRMLTLSFL